MRDGNKSLGAIEQGPFYALQLFPGDVSTYGGLVTDVHARVLILQGKKEDAAKELAQIPGEHPNSAAARMATERMNVLASEGVKVPPVAQPKPAELDGGIAQQGS